MRSILCFIYIFNIALSASGQDYLKLAKDALVKGRSGLGVDYARKAWQEQPSVYKAYYLAYGFFQLRAFDSAAFYSGIALADDAIVQDVQLTSKQQSQLNQILGYYEKILGQDEEDLVSTLYAGYSGFHTMRVRLILSDDDAQTKDLEKLAAIRQRQEQQPTWEEYLQSLREDGVDESVIAELEQKKLMDDLVDASWDTSTPEGLNRYITDLFWGGNDGEESGKESISIYWIDSTQESSSYYYDQDYSGYDNYALDWTDDDGDGWYEPEEVERNPYKHESYYFKFTHPELFDSLELQFLHLPMIHLYEELLDNEFDVDNELVKKYSLTRKNIEAFYQEFFPSIITNKSDLTSLKETLGW